MFFPPTTSRHAYPRWRYFALSHELADLYAIVWGVDVPPRPMPTNGLAGIPPSGAKSSLADEVTVAIVGHTSILKGGLLLKDIVDATLRHHPKVRFNLHLSTNPETRALDEEFKEGSERLTMRRGYISESDLQWIVDGSDIVVLPYARQPYRLMASAIFTQAAGSGKTAVVPAGTHMHRELLCHGGGYVTFGEHSAAAIVAALSSAIAGIAGLAAAADAAAPGYRARNSPRACFEKVLDAFADEPVPATSALTSLASKAATDAQASGSNSTMREPERSKRNGI